MEPLVVSHFNEVGHFMKHDVFNESGRKISQVTVDVHVPSGAAASPSRLHLPESNPVNVNVQLLGDLLNININEALEFIFAALEVELAIFRFIHRSFHK